ncbi:MAG: hypothetical protein F6J92_21700 [Symploca sp. SIO1A3]|nr:hypothetical protein [Symploca sp. SIO1A3]
MTLTGVMIHNRLKIRRIGEKSLITMEYWEFLIQKEGDRTWKPIKSSRIEIEPGRYRIVAHSSLKNAEVEISVIHQSLEEVPPKQRSQKRSRRTSPEGLMVVIPFTQLKSGIWELRCCGDIMSELMGEPWQQSVQLQVGSIVSEVVPNAQSESSLVGIAQNAGGRRQEAGGRRQEAEGRRQEAEPTPNPSQEGNRRQEVFSHTPTQEFALTDEDFKQPLPILPIEALEENPALETVPPGTLESRPVVEPTLVGTEVAQEQGNSEEDLTGLFPSSGVVSSSLDAFEEDKTEDKITANGQDSYITNLPSEKLSIANPILEQSLQTLEQIMQQVLEPVLDEFEQSEPSKQQSLIEPTPILEQPEDDQFAKTITNQLGLILTLEEEALVAHREELLAIVGQLDVLDVNQLNEQQQKQAWQQIFPGTLSYELRDPQTSQILLNTQYPLAEQTPPLTFSHSLELPENCNSRLLVGKVTFYGSNSQALVSQFFTVTADLDDVLGSILLGGKIMPVETMLAVANHITTSPEDQQKSAPLNEALLDLVDTPPISQPRPWHRSSSSPLPPQLYHRDSTQKSSPSIDLPSFPQQRIDSPQESEVSEEIPTELSSDIPTSPPTISSTELSKPEQIELKQEDAESLTELSEPEQIELKQEDAESLSLENEPLDLELPVNFVDNFFSKTLNQEPVNQEEETDERNQGLGQESVDRETQESPEAENGDNPQNSVQLEETASDLPLEPAGIESPDTTAASTTDTQLQDSDSMAAADVSEAEIPLTQSQTSPVEADETQGIENEFQALKLQDRFWSRLNSLVMDAELPTKVESDESTTSKTTEIEKLRNKLDSEDVTSQAAEVEEQEPIEFTEELPTDTVMADFDESLWEVTEDDDEVTDIADSYFVPLTNTNWVNQEIVVEEEEEEPLVSPAITSNGNVSGRVNQGEQEKKSVPEVNHPTASEISIPAPDLFVPRSELSAGEPVTVRIKLPPHPSRLYVKLWIKDRQSRLILDGPRSFVDFVPNASGELEELTQLIVPFGTVEIRFEAIAIDMYSQRESHKVAFDSKVISSDLPDISLEEFES